MTSVFYLLPLDTAMLLTFCPFALVPVVATVRVFPAAEMRALVVSVTRPIFKVVSVVPEPFEASMQA